MYFQKEAQGKRERGETPIFSPIKAVRFLLIKSCDLFLPLCSSDNQNMTIIGIVVMVAECSVIGQIFSAKFFDYQLRLVTSN